jgi:hypothetical protein
VAGCAGGGAAGSGGAAAGSGAAGSDSGVAGSAGGGAAGSGAGGAAGGAAGGSAAGQAGGAAGGSAAGQGGSAGASVGACPATPPVDFDDANVRAKCGKLVYVAGGDHMRAMISTDGGATWKSTIIKDLPGDDYVGSIAIEKGVIVLTGLPGVYTSADGGATISLVEAINHASSSTYGGQIAYGAGQFVLTDYEGTYTSTTGLTWTSVVPFPDGSAPNGFGLHQHGTGFLAGTYLFIQDKGATRTMKSNVWTQGVLVDMNHEARGVAVGKDMFVVCGQAGAAAFTATSTDGKTWNNVQTKDAGGAAFQGGDAGGLVFDGTTFRMYRKYSPKLGYTSTDGVAWTKVTLSNNLDAVAYRDGHFLGVGDGGILTSSDGVTWTSVHTFTADETAAQGGPRVAIGYALK